MADMGIFDTTTRFLKKALDLRWLNQKVISANIANAETPGYAAVHLDFKKSLERAMDQPELQGEGRDNPAFFPIAGQGGGEGTLVQTPDRSGIGDRNNVQVDQEMMSLSQNEILYQAATQSLNTKLGLLKYVIQGGQ
jgi:flagellar basal-body rod protein FlgB